MRRLFADQRLTRATILVVGELKRSRQFLVNQ